MCREKPWRAVCFYASERLCRVCGRGELHAEEVTMFSDNWKGYRTLAWVLQGLLAITIVAVLIQGKWLPALTLGGFLLVSFLFVKFEHKLPNVFDLIFMIAAL